MIPEYISRNTPLSDRTTFKIGGSADYFALPRTPRELADSLAFAEREKLRIYILGGGSNTLFSDAGYRGIVICTAGLSGVTRRGNRVAVLAGTSMDSLNDFLCAEGLSGLEFSGGLPGSVGGAAVMNARAYGGEMSQVVESIDCLKTDGTSVTLALPEIGYSYKQSVFMNNPALVIWRVNLLLKSSKPAQVTEETSKNRDDRYAKGQYAYPSAGCAYKNDYCTGIPSGRIIDSLGLKGISVGGARVYEQHANFIVNTGNARAADVIALLEKIEDTVYKEKGIKLEREVRVVE